MGLSRRDAMLAIMGGLAAIPTARFARAATKEPAPLSRTVPRNLVVIFLSGGPDGLLTLDPKAKNEVEPWVDNPVLSDNVQSGDVRLGALWAPLAKWSKEMTFLHGVQVETANHFSGSWQLLRMRRRGLLQTPSLLDLIARHREAPLGAITTGNLFNRSFSPGWLPLSARNVLTDRSQGLSMFDTVPPAELDELAAVLREHELDKSLRVADRESYRRVVAYLDGLRNTEKFKLEDWKTPVAGSGLEPAITGLQRVLWALEHELSSAALVYFGFNAFDTHWENLNRQRAGHSTFVPAFDRFLEGLHTRRNQRGTLAEQTTVIVAGELGRYARVNSDQGKDHFPEISMLFMGAGVNTGPAGNSIGKTGRDMMGLPMDLATGKLGGHRHVMLDDVGGTMLRMFGIEPTQYGYPAHPIAPLIA